MENISIVIIGQNESEYIDNMLDSLKIYNCPRYWVLDRCTDDSFQKLKNLNEENIILTPSHWEGRKVASSRNLGMYFALKDNIKSDILFLDGDRFITEGSISRLENYDKDVALLLLEDDTRNGITHYQEDCYAKVHNAFYSCGVFFKNSMIEKIINLQNGLLFNSDIEESWGIEDTYLGDVVASLKGSIDLFRDCKLRGAFDRWKIELDTIELRFRLRESLPNIQWL